MSGKPHFSNVHPERKGFHVVRKRLSNGTVRRYVYKHRGGPQVAVLDEDDDAERAIRDHIGLKRRDVVKVLVDGCRKRALARGIDFSIDEQWLQDRLYEAADRCAVTGLPFDYSSQRVAAFFKNPNKPSLDRLDNSRGYTPDNIRIVLHSVNVAMNEWGLDYYLSIAKAAVDYSARSVMFTGE